MLRKKLLVIAIVFWSSVFVINLLRPEKEMKTIDNDILWMHKFLWKNKLDIVITGDSRTLMGVSPEIITEHLPGLQIGNFGFPSLIYTDEYFAYCEELLKPDSKSRTVIFGISPRALITYEVEYCRFKEWSQTSRNIFAMKFIRHSGWLKHYFDEITMKDIKNYFNPAPPEYLSVNLPSGWTAARMMPENPGYTVKSYRRRYQELKVDQKRVNLMMKYTGEWREKGINVLGFWMPTGSAIYFIEEKTSGITEDYMKNRLEKAGGTWLNIDTTGYHVYDGSHLRYDAAVSFSHSLGRNIKTAIGVK